MKIVFLKNNIVCEIIPDYALPVEEWYGEEFASCCVEAPEEVAEGWTYKNGEWCEYIEPEVEPSIEEITLLTLADHEERLCMIELGVNE